MLPIGVRIRVRAANKLTKRNSGASSGSVVGNTSGGKKSSTGKGKGIGKAAKIPQRPKRKKAIPPTKKFLSSSQDRAAKLAKKQKKQAIVEEREFHVLSRRPAWADDKGDYYGVYGAYFYRKQQQLQAEEELRQRLNAAEEDEESEMTEEKRVRIQEEQSRAMSAHRRWLRKNKVIDGKANGTAAGQVGGKKTQTATPKTKDGAAILLYVGTGLTIVGLILTVVGAGDDGFKTPELQLVGPSLIGMGVFFCFLRILTCAFREHCARCCPRCCPQYVPKNQPLPLTTTKVLSAAETRTVDTLEEQQQTTSAGDDAAGDADGAVGGTSADAGDVESQAPTPPLPATPRYVPERGSGVLIDEDHTDDGIHETKVLIDRTILSQTKVNFVNEVGGTKKTEDVTVDSDFDITEFEEIEFDSPRHQTKMSRNQRKQSISQRNGEIVLDPSKLVS